MADQYTIQELAAALGVAVCGDGSITVTGAAEPQDAGPQSLAIAIQPKYQKNLSLGNARAALLGADADWRALGLDAAICLERPRFGLAAISRHFDQHWRRGAGIHPTAIIDASACVGRNAHIGAFCVIGPGVVLGDDAWLGHHVTIGEAAEIGPMATIHDRVTLGAGVIIGSHFVAHPGAVVGADGFSFVSPEVSAVENIRETLGDRGDAQPQKWARIHSLGGVEIGDHVELGANACIDRGSIRATRIGNGCKFDNLSQIGHNVEIGNDCLICAQVGIAGSSKIGNNVVLGGQTGVSDNVFIGDNVITGGATKVLSNIPAGRVMLGYPAMKMDQQMSVYKLLRRLPKLFSDVSDLKNPK